MPILLVRSTKAISSGQATLSLTLAGVVAGNKLVLFANNWQGQLNVGGGITSITSSPTLTWRRDVAGAPSDQYTAGQPAQAAIWSADAISSASYTLTITFSGNDTWAQCVLAEFSGLQTGASSLDLSQSQGGFAATASTGDTVADSGASSGTTAMRSFDFIDTIGVGTHLDQGNQYSNVDAVITALQYLGVRHHREGTNPLSTTTKLNNIGIKQNFIVDAGGGPLAAFNALKAMVQRHPGYVVTTEGPNEVDIQPVSYNGQTGVAGAQAYQTAYYNYVKNDPVTAYLPVLNFTWGVGPPNKQGTCDFGNIHAYRDSGSQFGSGIQWYIDYQSGANPGKLLFLTETGYYTLPQDDNWGGVDERSQAAMSLNTIFRANERGIKRTFFYQLLDQYNDGRGREEHFGLFRYDFTRKPVADAIHNLIVLLGDNASNSTTFTPVKLNYTLSGTATALGSKLLQKANGTFMLGVWAEPDIWNEDTNSPITAPTRSITVNLGQSFPVVRVYDPMVGTSAATTLSNVSSVVLSITDHPLLIEIPTGSSAPVTAQANELIVATLAVEAYAAVNIPVPAKTGYTNIANDAFSDAVAFSTDYKVISDVGSQKAQWGPLTTSNPWFEWSASIASYKAAVDNTAPQTVVLTSGSNWTVPSGITNLSLVEAWGAGGGGGNRGSQPATGGGGGAYSSITNYAVTAGQVINISIGAGGIVQTVANDGFAGGDTWFANATTLFAKGGGGGLGATSGAHAGGAGGLASAGIGTTKYSGGNGGSGSVGGSATGGGGSASKSSDANFGGNTTTTTATIGGTAGLGAGAGGTVGTGKSPANNVEGGGGGAGTIASGENAGTGASPGGGGGAAGGASNFSGAGGSGQIRITYSGVTPVNVGPAGTTKTAASTLIAGSATGQRRATPNGKTFNSSIALLLGSVAANTVSAIAGVAFAVSSALAFTPPDAIPGVASPSVAGINFTPPINFVAGATTTIRGVNLNPAAFNAGIVNTFGSLIGVRNAAFVGSNLFVSASAVYGSTNSNVTASTAGVVFNVNTDSIYGSAAGTTPATVSGVNYTVIIANSFGSSKGVRVATPNAAGFAPTINYLPTDVLAMRNKTTIGADFFSSAAIVAGNVNGGKSIVAPGYNLAAQSSLLTGSLKGIDNRVQAGFANTFNTVFTPGILTVGLAGNFGGINLYATSNIIDGSIEGRSFAAQNGANYSINTIFSIGSKSTVRNGITDAAAFAPNINYNYGVGLSGTAGSPVGFNVNSITSYSPGLGNGQRSAIPAVLNKAPQVVFAIGNTAGVQNPVIGATQFSNVTDFIAGNSNAIRLATPQSAAFIAVNTLLFGTVETQRSPMQVGGTFASASAFLPGVVTTGFNANALGVNINVSSGITAGQLIGGANQSISGFDFNNNYIVLFGQIDGQSNPIFLGKQYTTNVIFNPGIALAKKKRNKVRIILIIGSLIDDRLVIE